MWPTTVPCASTATICASWSVHGRRNRDRYTRLEWLTRSVRTYRPSATTAVQKAM